MQLHNPLPQWQVERELGSGRKEKEEQAEVFISDKPGRPDQHWQESFGGEAAQEQHQPGRHPKSEKVSTQGLGLGFDPLLAHSGRSVAAKTDGQGALSLHPRLEPARSSLSIREPVQRRR